MESFFSRFKSALVLVAVLLAQVIGLASQMKRVDYGSREDGHHVRGLRAWQAYTIAPVESLLKHMGGGVRGVWHNYVDLRHVRQHDKDLQYQIDQLRLREASLAEDARQGQRLQQLLAFKQKYVGKTVAAQVIGTAGGDQGRVVILDKGSNDGIRTDMAVITPDGAVGKIRDVFAMSSQVLLLNDPTSGAGVILLNTRSRGILRGGPGGTLLINNLLPDERIKAGEPLITSGGDRVYPRGLPIGNVISMKADPEHQPYALITIKPAANLDRLEEVLVVTEMTQQLDTASNDDQEEGRRAADVVADRLPSLKKPDTKDDADAGNTATPTLAKPQPAIHVDHYSPGAAPPAADLTPGARGTQIATPPQRPASSSPEEQ